MPEIYTLVEHRKGEIRDITYEMLARARELARGQGVKSRALLLSHGGSKLAEALAAYADVVEVIDDPKLEHFNSDAYQEALASLVRSRKPLLMMMGHTSFGMDLAPSLAAELEMPLITDATSVDLVSGTVVAIRPVYGGKAKARVRAKGPGAVVTVQSGAFAASEPAAAGEIVRGEVVISKDLARKKFLDFVEALAEDVDITQSDIVVSVGRGIGDPESIPVVEALANALGGVLACSRPVVDKKWLPKSRQVGISGKTVRPKLYLAVGISGAFQHLAGMKGSKTIVAINKDPNAPIFQVADYGVVGDLFQVVPALTERIGRGKK